MYIKKMLMIIIIFITSLIGLSVLSSIVFSIMAGDATDKSMFFENIFKLPLYIIGYGESPSVSRYFQLVLCIAGIIMVNFLNAYLTVALFRFRSVKITPALIKNEDTGFSTLFKVANRGKQIYNVSLMLQVYKEDENGDIVELGEANYCRKLINAKKAWTIRHNLEESDPVFAFFKSHYHGSADVKIQGILEYLDNDTGNQILSVTEFFANDFNAKGLTEAFKKYTGVNYKTIDLHRVRKIVENGDDDALAFLFAETKQGMAVTARLNFRVKGKKAQPGFVMALIESLPAEDWSVFYKLGYSLDFDICSSPSVNAVHLEIKSDYGGSLKKIADLKIETFKAYHHHTLKLKDISATPDFWNSIRELCFICFPHDSNKDTGEFSIRNLKLIAHHDGIKEIS